MTQDQHSSAVYLVGYRASGKTTVGRALAARLCCEFVDTDHLVETEAGREIAVIFQESGEEAFRHLESEILRRVCERASRGEELVVATGGGVVLLADNIKLMRNSGKVVWLRAPAAVLEQRIGADPATGRSRPPLQGASAASEVEEVLKRRYPLYEASAECIVDTGDLDPEEVCSVIATALREKPE
ncbi:MAG: shikimate kinase [Planctomycetota bacterium]|nr:shikimate kinase [Planctomycetota bacterium]